MLFHVTITHRLEDCPGRRQAESVQLIGPVDRLKVLGDELSVTSHSIVWGASCILWAEPEHVAYALLEAPGLEAVERYLDTLTPAGWSTRVLPVFALPSQLAAVRQFLAAPASPFAYPPAPVAEPAADLDSADTLQGPAPESAEAPSEPGPQLVASPHDAGAQLIAELAEEPPDKRVTRIVPQPVVGPAGTGQPVVGPAGAGQPVAEAPPAEIAEAPSEAGSQLVATPPDAGAQLAEEPPDKRVTRIVPQPVIGPAGTGQPVPEAPLAEIAEAPSEAGSQLVATPQDAGAQLIAELAEEPPDKRVTRIVPQPVIGPAGTGQPVAEAPRAEIAEAPSEAGSQLVATPPDAGAQLAEEPPDKRVTRIVPQQVLGPAGAGQPVAEGPLAESAEAPREPASELAARSPVAGEEPTDEPPDKRVTRIVPQPVVAAAGAGQPVAEGPQASPRETSRAEEPLERRITRPVPQPIVGLSSARQPVDTPPPAAPPPPIAPLPTPPPPPIAAPPPVAPPPIAPWPTPPLATPPPPQIAPPPVAALPTAPPPPIAAPPPVAPPPIAPLPTPPPATTPPPQIARPPVPAPPVTPPERAAIPDPAAITRFIQRPASPEAVVSSLPAAAPPDVRTEPPSPAELSPSESSTVILEPGAQRVAGLRLVASSGPAQGTLFEVGEAGATIGRLPENSICLTDGRLSRFHARIEFRDGGYWLSDVGSQNGTLVNDRPVTDAHRLQAGDLLQLGTSRLTVMLDPED